MTGRFAGEKMSAHFATRVARAANTRRTFASRRAAAATSIIETKGEQSRGDETGIRLIIRRSKIMRAYMGVVCDEETKFIPEGTLIR